MERFKFVKTCDVCGITVEGRSEKSVSRALVIHLGKKHGKYISKLTCFECKATFDNVKDFNTHSRTHESRILKKTKKRSSKINPSISGAHLKMLHAIKDYRFDLTIEQTLNVLIEYYYQKITPSLKANKMKEKEKMEELKEFAVKKGYILSESAGKIVSAMFKKEKRVGGLYCPCKNVLIMSDEEKKKCLCPCEYLDADIKESGVCFCGLFKAGKKE